MATVTWSEKSLSDLEEIYEYIALDSPFYAQHQVTKVIVAVERLMIFPTSGRSLPEFPASPLREVIVDPYRI